MKILIACEESQVVCKAFRAKGHEAYSCDIQDCSGGHPEWHIKGDVSLYLDGFPAFCVDGGYAFRWDMIIAHPPCTRLANSGVMWLKKRNLWGEMESGARFFKKFMEADCPKIAIENPIMHKYAKVIIGRGQDQLIQPYMFGHPERKATCLWLKGLPKLEPTNNVKTEMEALPKSDAQRIHWMPPGPERSKLRSKTFQGIADAMADQWGGVA